MVDTYGLIGVPFEYGGRGPDKFDCFGLCKWLYEARRGVALPDLRSPVDAAQQLAMVGVQISSNWRKVPFELDSVVLFQVKGMLIHCGYVIDEDRFIHTWEQSGGVVIERLSDWRHRIEGFYVHVGA